MINGFMFSAVHNIQDQESITSIMACVQGSPNGANGFYQWYRWHYIPISKDHWYHWENLERTHGNRPVQNVLYMGKVPPTASPSHQPQSVAYDRGQVYSTCVRSVMLHTAETWAVTMVTLNFFFGFSLTSLSALLLRRANR